MVNRGWTEKHIEELVKKFAKGGSGGDDILNFDSMYVWQDDTDETVWWAEDAVPDDVKTYYENDATYRMDGCWWIGSATGYNNHYFNSTRNVTINDEFYEDLVYEAYWHCNYFELPKTIYELLIRHTNHNPFALYNPRYGSDENTNVIYPIFVTEYNENVQEIIVHPCVLYFKTITPYGGSSPYTHDVRNIIASIQQDTSDTACHFYDKFTTDETTRQQRYNYLKEPLSKREVTGIYILERKSY